MDRETSSATFAGSAMASSNPRRRTLASTISRSALPTLASVMIFSTGVAVVLGYSALKRCAPSPDCSRLLKEYAMVVAATGVAEFVALAVGLAMSRCLSKRIARPVEELASRALAAVRGHETVPFPVDGPIEEINRLSTAFNSLFKAQEARIKELKELSSNVLHDLRTPLTTVRNSAELAMSGRIDIDEAGARVIDATGTILDLIAVNSEIAQNYSGYAQPAEDVNVTEAVLSVVDLLSPVAEEKGISLKATSPERPVRLFAHRSKIVRLAGNLVDNALKFTPRGGKVEVSLAENGGTVILKVSDTGIGIDSKDIPRIFDRFFRCDLSRHTPGFGLGLSLVHAIAAFYGGSVSCDSAIGQGTVFTVALPSCTCAQAKALI